MPGVGGARRHNASDRQLPGRRRQRCRTRILRSDGLQGEERLQPSVRQCPGPGRWSAARHPGGGIDGTLPYQATAMHPSLAPGGLLIIEPSDVSEQVFHQVDEARALLVQRDVSVAVVAKDVGRTVVSICNLPRWGGKREPGHKTSRGLKPPNQHRARSSTDKQPQLAIRT